MVLNGVGVPAAGSLVGTFVGIEMMAGAGEKAGITKQMMPVSAATLALQGFLTRWHREKAAEWEAASLEERAKWTWKDVVHGTQATLALGLLSLCSAEDGQAQIFFSRKFKVISRVKSSLQF